MQRLCRLYTLLVAIALILVWLAGCSQQSSPRGGERNHNRTFYLTAPAGSTVIQQGETKNFKVTIERDQNYTDEVTLTAQPPESGGLTCVFGDDTFKGDVTVADLKVSAAPDAKLGKHIVCVVGRPKKGDAVDLQLNVEVTASPAKKAR